MTLPAWITDSIYNQVKTIVETCEDYIFGSAGFGKSENSELIKLKGGLLLQEMINNMENHGGIKLHMFSAVRKCLQFLKTSFFCFSMIQQFQHFFEL